MYIKKTETRIRQGDIFENYRYEFSKIEKDKVETTVINFPFIIILTQDCDLESDYYNRNETKIGKNNDKYIPEILFAPAYKEVDFKSGEHLSVLGFEMEKFGKDRWSYLKSNQNKRYHFFTENLKYNIPALVIDFKHYYTLSRDDIYPKLLDRYKISIDIPYREDFSQRFAYYLSRIGLPN